MSDLRCRVFRAQGGRGSSDLRRFRRARGFGRSGMKRVEAPTPATFCYLLLLLVLKLPRPRPPPSSPSPLRRLLLWQMLVLCTTHNFNSSNHRADFAERSPSLCFSESPGAVPHRPSRGEEWLKLMLDCDREHRNRQVDMTFPSRSREAEHTTQSNRTCL